MAVLGVGGRLLLRREAPSACLINPTSISAESDTIASLCGGYWSGDHIAVDCLPAAGDGFPAGPKGYASYFGGSWFVGPNRDHIDANADAFYKTDTEEYPDTQFGDDAQFYARSGDTSGGEEIPACTPGDYWIHIDALGNVSFYNSRCDALSGCANKRVELLQVGNSFAIAPYGTLEYQNAVWECVLGVGEYQYADGRDNVTLESVCADPPLYENPDAGGDEYDNADFQPRGRLQGQSAPYWQVMCEIREWSLNLDAPSVDTTSVGEKFGEAVKSIVTGGGSVDYLIDKKCHEDGVGDGTDLMRLLLMTERGCQASAKFYMLDRGGDPCNQSCEFRAGSLYYESELLVTGSAVNLRPTEVVAGTANFVTTGEIRLLEAH